nr:MAG TPA: hypothetical protein [Caudoviricetes sp.]
MITFLSDFLARLHNARNVVEQIKRGEWEPIINSHCEEALTAKRDGYRLWLGNGPFFCDVEEFNGVKCKPAFGLLLRHYVWYAAAGNLKRNAENKQRNSKHFPKL